MFTLALIAMASPVTATHAHAPVYRSHDIAGALRAGCRVQQVSTPAGKIGNHAAIIRCPAAAREAARAARR